MSKDQALCRLEDIPDGGAVEAQVPSASGGFTLVVLRRGEAVYAYHNECPHAGRPLNWAPGKFLVEDGVLVCAVHGASFVVDSGQCTGGPCRGERLTGLPVEVREGQVRLRQA